MHFDNRAKKIIEFIIYLIKIIDPYYLTESNIFRDGFDAIIPKEVIALDPLLLYIWHYMRYLFFYQDSIVLYPTPNLRKV